MLHRFRRAGGMQPTRAAERSCNRGARRAGEQESSSGSSSTGWAVCAMLLKSCVATYLPIRAMMRSSRLDTLCCMQDYAAAAKILKEWTGLGNLCLLSCALQFRKDSFDLENLQQLKPQLPPVGTGPTTPTPKHATKTYFLDIRT